MNIDKDILLVGGVMDSGVFTVINLTDKAVNLESIDGFRFWLPKSAISKVDDGDAIHPDLKGSRYELSAWMSLKLQGDFSNSYGISQFDKIFK